MQQAPNNMTCHPHTCLIIKDQTSEAEEYGRLSGICCDGVTGVRTHACACVCICTDGGRPEVSNITAQYNHLQNNPVKTQTALSPLLFTTKLSGRCEQSIAVSPPHRKLTISIQERTGLVPNWRCRKNMLPVRSATENITQHYTAQQGTAGTEKEVLKKLEISWGKGKHFSLDNL